MASSLRRVLRHLHRRPGPVILMYHRVAVAIDRPLGARRRAGSLP